MAVSSLLLLLAAAASVPQDADLQERRLLARDLVDDFQGSLYDPVAAGLHALAFDVHLPAGDSSVRVHVDWQRRGEAQAQSSVSGPLPGEAAIDAEDPEVAAAVRAGIEGALDVVLARLDDTGDVHVAVQLNRDLEHRLAGRDARLLATDGELTRIDCPPLLPGDRPARLTLFFDGHGTWRRAVRVDGVFVHTTDLEWQPLDAPGGGLVLSRARSIESRVDDPAPRGVETRTLAREDLSGYRLVTSITTRGPAGEQVIRFTGFVVNGTPVETAWEAAQRPTEEGGEGLGEVEEERR